MLPLMLLAVLQAPAPISAPAPPSPEPTLRAQYSWGYVGTDGQGKGTLNMLIDPATGRTVLELFGLGERLVFLEGSTADGFHLLIPRRKVDLRAPTLKAIPLPFFPMMESPAGLYRLIRKGEGPDVKVTKRDQDGPVKMRYDGKDDRGHEVTVWLQRTRWEVGAPTPGR